MSDACAPKLEQVRPGMFAFTKNDRILKKLEFKTVLDGGLKVVTNHLVVYGIRSARPPRLGLVVSKKVGSAVVRNQVKRRIREIFRHRRPELAKDSTSDFVVIARYTAGQVSFEELSRAFDHCLTRIQNRLKLQPETE